MKNKILKGQYGFRNARKKKDLELILILTASVIFQIVWGRYLGGTFKLLLTVTGILTVLPLANAAAPFLTMLPYKTPEKGFHDDILPFEKNGEVLYDLILTTREQIIPLDACFVDGNSVIAFCPSEKVPSEKVREWIRTALRKDGLTPETVVCSDRNGFIRALKQKTRMEENTVGSEKIQKTVSILKSISY